MSTEESKKKHYKKEPELRDKFVSFVSTIKNQVSEIYKGKKDEGLDV